MAMGTSSAARSWSGSRIRRWSSARIDGADVLIEQRPATAQEVATYEQAETNATIAELRDQATKALDKNKTFLALDPPNNAQMAAQIEALTKQMNGLIRQVIGPWDDINDSVEP